MRKLDIQEEKIVKQLIRNPRMSDNKIGKVCRIPVMTVNRKRKKLEEEGILLYYVNLNRGNAQSFIYQAHQMYTIQFKIGISRDDYLDQLKNNKKFITENARYHSDSYLGEQDGHLALVILLEGEDQTELFDTFNKIIIPNLKKRLGEDCINAIQSVRLDFPVRIHHNYLPTINMDLGTIKEDWLDDYIFVQ